jgi:hypothetical protein
LNYKRPDGDSVKETSPLSKFLGICTTIQGHDLFAIPINKTVGSPCLSPSLLPSNLRQSKLSFSTSAPQKINGGQWQQASCQRRSRRKPRWLPSEVVIVNSLCDFFQDFLFASDDLLLFKAHPLESGPRAGQSSSAGRLLGVV